MGDKRQPAKIGDEVVIPAKTKHRLEAGATALVVLEIARGTFDENDIVRVDDRYGRENETESQTGRQTEHPKS